MSREPSIFERIIERQLPADIVYEDDQHIVIRDIAPKAPIHLLVIPKTFSSRLDEMSATEVSALYSVALDIAAQQTPDFRLVVNCGSGAGQMVPHTHVHILGGWTEAPDHL